jgi:hypothetical protein
MIDITSQDKRQSNMNFIKKRGDLKCTGRVGSSHFNSNTVRSCYPCSKPDKTVIYLKLLIIECNDDRGIDTIINDNYDILWRICFIGGENRRIR